MGAETAEVARLTRQVEDRKARLRYTLTKLRGNLQPAQLVDEVSRPLRNASAELVDKAASTASGPVGIAAAGIAALLGGGALWVARSKAREPSSRPAPVMPVKTASANAPPPEKAKPTARRNDAGTLLKFLGAAALGIGLSRVLPTLGPEQAVLSGVGEDVRKIASQWAKSQASTLMLPRPGERFTLLNLAAIAGALLVASRKSQTV